jgi:hypothetical protein
MKYLNTLFIIVVSFLKYVNLTYLTIECDDLVFVSSFVLWF